MKQVFEKCIFCDVNIDKLDIDKKADFVIARVFERGDVEDIRQCRRYYGDEKIALALLNIKYLPEHTMYFAAAIINKDITEFRCYKLRQLNPELYPY